MSNSLISTPTAPAQITKVQYLIARPQAVFNFLCSEFRNAVTAIWLDPNPQNLLNELQAAQPGAPAELFERSFALAAFLEHQLPGCTAPIAALIKPVTINADGSVTITPTAAPASATPAAAPAATPAAAPAATPAAAPAATPAAAPAATPASATPDPASH